MILFSINDPSSTVRDFILSDFLQGLIRMFLIVLCINSIEELSILI
jgi:hypothetical protein